MAFHDLSDQIICNCDTISYKFYFSELGMLSGVAAILRFPIPEPEEDEDSSDND